MRNTSIGNGSARAAGLALCLLACGASLLASGCVGGTKASSAAPEGLRFLASDGKRDFAPAPVRERPGAKAGLEVTDEPAAPPLEGFGGAFNEKGWVALQSLKPEERARALDMIFKPELGLSLSLCRIPIGSSDYALSRYSLDDVPGDYPMESFSLERDRKDLLPYIQAARELRPDLRFWASAWSPPGWLKTNGSSDSGSMLDDPRAYAAYALYLKKFSQAYAKEGVKVEAIAVQNEPTVLRNYPSCGWTPEQYRTFIRDYLGPSLEGTGSGVMLGTFNDPSNMSFAMETLGDPKAAAYVQYLGLQWFALPIAPLSRQAKPGLRVWHTETDCGNHNWEPGFDPDKPQNDFAYAAYTWGKMRDYLAAGASLYSLWNIVLDPEGKSIDSQVPWPQNAAIVADPRTGKAVYTPMFYAFSSFSRFIPPGSRLLAGPDAYDAIAFLLPGGGKAVVLMNEGAAPRSYSINLDGRTLEAKLGPRSFGVLIAEKRP